MNNDELKHALKREEMLCANTNSPLVLTVIFTGFLYKSIVGTFAALLLSLAAVSLWRTRFKILGIALTIALTLPPLTLGTSSLYSRLHTYVHRYRLVVEVETPTGIQSSASVIQVSYAEYMLVWNPSASGLKIQPKGEAIFFDLGNGRNLVVTLGFGPTGTDVDTLSALAAKAFGRYQAFWYKQAPSWGGRAELHGGLIPTLVTFGDPANPYTVQFVKPDEFATVFGPGYRFKGAWIEMTRDDVTRAGIEEKLPWLNNMEKYRRDPKNPFTNMLPFNTLLFTRRL